MGGSIYETVQGTYRKYNHWPNPYSNMVKNISVLACEDTWQAKVEMFVAGFGNWAFSTFVPQPTELFRKTITGSYKCGFYLGLKWKSPIDVVWADDSVSTMLLEVTRPVTTGIFYLWAVESLWSALSTWSSLVYASEICDADRNECLLKFGGGDFFGTDAFGDCTGYEELWDPNGWYTPPGAPVSYFIGFLEAHAVGKVTAVGENVTDLTIALHGLGWPTAPAVSEAHIGPMSSGETRTFSLDASIAVSNNGAVAVGAIYKATGSGLAHIHVEVTRFTVHNSPSQPERPCKDWSPGGGVIG